MSIYAAYRQCVQASRELCDSLRAQHEGPEAIPTSFRNDIGRFKVWAKNSGAHRKKTNSMSLDHRLREASDVKNMVVKLLEDLKAALQDATTASREPSTNALDSDAVETQDTESDKSEESDTDSEFEECNEFEECLLDVNNTVTCLYNLSIAIANPAPRDRLENCASIDVSYYHQHDIDHVSNKFPVAEEYLVNRLGKANSKRRQLLQYYERHHKRVAGNPRVPADLNADELHDFADLEFESLADTTNQTVTTVSTFVPADGITAMSLDAGLDDEPDFDTRSVTSYASSIGNADRLRVPPPPNEESAFEGIPFECPYCFSLVKVEGQQSWKRHVFRDLRPYACTFPTCQRSEHLFESRHEWFEHEKTFHRREWFCSACQEICATEAAFRGHLVQTHTHAGPSYSEKMQALIDRSARAIESKQRCCFCDQDDLSPHLLQRHIGRHMQQLSLFVLPGSEADDESDRSSDSADHEEGSENGDDKAEDDKKEDGQPAEGDLPAGPEALLSAATRGQVSEVQLLLDHGVDIESKDGDGKTALHLVAHNGHESVVQLLLDRGADIESTFGQHNSRALHTAAEHGHESVVRLLLDHGADIESKYGPYNHRALHAAAQNGHEPVVRLLLDRGADIESKLEGSNCRALHMAANYGHESVVRLLLDRGANIESTVGPSNGRALHVAAQNGHEAVVRLLLDRGADIESKYGQYNHRALHVAAPNGHEAVVRLLLDRGADIESTYGQYNNNRALHIAAEEGHESVVRLLLDRGADVGATDEDGKTALDWAAQHRHEGIVELLRGRESMAQKIPSSFNAA